MDSLLLKRQQESAGQQHPARAPRLLVEQQQQQPPASVLALFVHEPDSSKFTTTGPSSGSNILSIIPSSAPTAYPRPGSLFSLSQWRELELQALIYKYIVAGASVPLELILLIRRGLLNATPYYRPYQHFHLAMMPASYLGGSTSDPEPGRCKRTDGKKWRCSREVVAGHKYCERHMHRGRSRSRKHVEVPAHTTSGGSGMARAPFSPSPLAGAGLPSPLHVLPLNRRHPGGSDANESLPQTYCRSFAAEKLGDGRPGSRTLRHFFDDWPSEQQQEPNNANGSSTGGPPTSTVKLSISVPEQPPKSDISLKLSTCSSEKRSPHGEAAPGDAAVQPIRASSWSGWAGQPAASVGGPLAEALRSSSSTPSPTSVLLKPNASASETTSSVST